MPYHCFASFKQSPLDFFKLFDSQHVLMLLYDTVFRSYNQWGSPITSGLLGSQVRKSEVERFGLCCIQDVPLRCLTKRQNYCLQCVWW